MNPQALVAPMPIRPLFLPDDPLLFLSFLIQIRQLTLQDCFSAQHWPHSKFMWKALILLERRGSKECLGRKPVGRPDAWPWGRGPECARGEGWALHILKKTSWKAFELNPICVPISEIRIEVQRGSVSPLRSQWVSEGPGLHLRLLITEPHTRHSAMAAQDSGFGFQNPKQGKWVIVLSSQVIWRVGDSGVSFLLDCRSRSDL